MTEDVFFLVDGIQVSYAYDRPLLFMGAIVHVRFDDQGHAISFSPHISEDSIPYSVVWMAGPRGQVFLESRYEISEEPVDLATSFLFGLMNKSDIVHAFEIAAKDIRLDHLYSAEELERSRVAAIASVADRLRLVSHMWPNLKGRDAYQYEPLVTYLLLTCFDRLGQPPDWLDFGAWLRASHTQGERESVCSTTKDTEPTEAAAILYDSYNQMYGVRRAFFRFLDSILPGEARAELLSCIRIEEIALPPNSDQRRRRTDHEKLEYLFGLRNSFTHSLRGIRGVAKDLLEPPEWARGRRIWRVAEQRIEDRKWIVLYVRNWPEIIESTVRKGLSAYLQGILSGS